jgi:tryptophan-rich sensory protein
MAAGWVGYRMYSELEREWIPRSLVFTVWSTLYIFPGIAAWLVWWKVGFIGAQVVLGLFFVQLVLYSLVLYSLLSCHCSSLFRMSTFVIGSVVLWLVNLIITIWFWRVSVLAGVLFLPYLCWWWIVTVFALLLWRFCT